MIRRLRRRQRWLLLVLTVLLPAVFAIGLLNRKPPAIMRTPPAAIMDRMSAPLLEVAVLPHLFTDPTIGGRVLADSLPPQRLAVELVPTKDPREPDLLVYWTAESIGPGQDVPASAVLLGTLAGRRPRVLRLPDGAVSAGGTLVLYSLGHRRLVATGRLPVLDSSEMRAAP